MRRNSVYQAAHAIVWRPLADCATPPVVPRFTAATCQRRPTLRMPPAAGLPGPIPCSKTMPNSAWACGLPWTSKPSTRPSFCGAWPASLGDQLAGAILTADQSTEAGIAAQRARIAELKQKLSGVDSAGGARLARRRRLLGGQERVGSSAATGGPTTSALAASITSWARA